MPTERKAVDGLEPMYASIGHEVPRGRGWTFEPKYDGVRVLAHADSRGVRLITRNGNDKAKQFPEVAAAIAELAIAAGRRFILDGEIVALVRNKPARFQALQGRMHLKGGDDIAAAAAAMPAAIVAFDLLRDGSDVLVRESWTERRAALEDLLDPEGPATASAIARHVRLSPTKPGGATMLRQARKSGWEGVIAKRTDSIYELGARSESWLKLKIEFEQEFVVGGFTAPRRTRENIGALLLGYFDEAGKLVYVGHTGGGFTRTSLAEMHRRLSRLIRKTPPFATVPKTNEPATWVRPEVVVQVKFSEWTEDNRLRQPIFLGIRDDKAARDVDLESASVQRMRERGSTG